MTVGERIRLRREELGLSQEELAARLGLRGRSSVCKAEKSGNSMTLKTAAMYARALECEPDVLLGWSNENLAKVDYELFNKEKDERTALFELYDTASDTEKELVKRILGYYKKDA